MTTKLSSKPLSYLSAFLACFIMSLTTACASGGFKWTRKYASFVNSQHIIVRIILYILTSIVFAITMLVDMVIFNTLDFWEGRTAAGTYNFKEGEKTFIVKHEQLGDKKLRQSTIKVMDKSNKLLQEVVLVETATGELEMFVDGKLRTRVNNIKELPVAAIFDENGKLVKHTTLLLNQSPMTTVAR